LSGGITEAPTDFTPYELAEWLEMHMLLDELESISRSSIATLFPAGQGPDGAELDQLFAEIRRRAEGAPSLYPFRAIGETVQVDESVDATVYRFLQLLSVEAAPFRKESRYNEVNPSFELLTREALIAYAGPGAEGRRFGWPNGDGRPEHLGDAVRWLAGEMGLGVGVVDSEVDSDDKDGGIDVAAWKPFPDGGPSFTSYLAQCTVQMTYERKPADIVAEKWIAWISFGKAPESVLSIPFAIPKEAKVRTDLKYKVNVLLDRLRLVHLLDHSVRPLNEFQEYKEMKAWTSAEIGYTKAASSSPLSTTPRRPKVRKPFKPRNPNAPVV
jgi:hypothetical protein